MAVEQRSGGWCELRFCLECRVKRNRAATMHHRLRRSQRGPHTAQNLRDTCVWCHDEVHIYIKQAKKVGHILTRATARKEGIIEQTNVV